LREAIHGTRRVDGRQTTVDQFGHIRGHPGRIPTTLVVAVPLTMKPQTVLAMWQNVRGSTVNIDSPATLSAILS
jgi:hypothetical protein